MKRLLLFDSRMPQATGAPGTDDGEGLAPPTDQSASGTEPLTPTTNNSEADLGGVTTFDDNDEEARSVHNATYEEGSLLPEGDDFREVPWGSNFEPLPAVSMLSPPPFVVYDETRPTLGLITDEISELLGAVDLLPI